ncbi:MAG: hypothetical protein HZA74_12580, partial [Ignavibacteriales bacterium]|nr:hypothetical protein [Ignavibacteriales bacterium]
MKVKGKLKYIYLFFFFLNSLIFSMTWEVGFRLMNSNNSAMIATISVYKFNYITRDLDYFDSGFTKDSFTGFGDNYTNGAFDIGDNETDNPTISSLPIEGTYYIRIYNKFFIIEYSGLGGYGDMRFIYQDGNMSLEYNNSGFFVLGPYTWTTNTITLANDFGSDRQSCYGNVIFNSITLTNVGFNGITQTRESTTFPHTISGEDNQYVNNHYRKWRNWENSIYNTNISTTLSLPKDYVCEATYAKKVIATINTNVRCSNINVNDIEADPSAYMYDDIQNTVLAPSNGYSDGLYYEFSYWVYNSSYIYDNPMQVERPTNDVTIFAHFTCKPDNSGKNVHFSKEVGLPIKIYWTDNVNPNVTYKIYRKVYKNGVWNNETLIGEVGKGVENFEDPDYLLANFKQYDLLNYDVRECYTIEGTYLDPQWNSVYGQIYKITEGKDITEIEEELPTSYSVSNYPNPFNPETVINYQLPESGFVTLKVYDILGKEIATLVNEYKEAGF